MDDLAATLMISASGLRAQSVRMRVISENLANADTVGTTPNDTPYRRKVVTFSDELNRQVGADVVKVDKVGTDSSPFGMRYEPGHPAANANGYVRVPNVNSLLEMADMKQAQRTYEANLNVIEAARGMEMRTIDLLKG